MDRRIPTLQRRMRLIQPGLLRQFLTERAPFAHRVAMHQIPRFIAFVRALAQTPQATPFGRYRPHARADNQRPGRAAAERNPVLSLPGRHRPLHALRHHANTKNCQPGTNHPPPQAAFRAQYRFHHRFGGPLLFSNHFRQHRREGLRIGSVKGAGRF